MKAVQYRQRQHTIFQKISFNYIFAKWK